MWNEQELLNWLGRQEAARGLAGSVGHDAAILRRVAERPVLCTDQTREGIHFVAGTSEDLVARKAVGRVLSDLAACGATPKGLLLALSAPPEATTRQLKALLRATRRWAREHGTDLVGGDLCCAEGGLALAVTGFGAAPAGPTAGRDRARPGDWIVATGPTGGSALGRHLRIEPRLREGRRLMAAGAHAMMDTSDGLAIDLERLARASKMRIDLERVPEHPDAQRLARRTGRTARWHALFDGEDHELLCALPKAAAQRVLRRRNYQHIGNVRTGSGLWFRGADREHARDSGEAAGTDGAPVRRWKRAPAEGWVHGRE